LRNPVNNNEILSDEEFVNEDGENNFNPLMEAAQQRGHEKRLHIMAELGNF